jgi:hypothetical protein
MQNMASGAVALSTLNGAAADQAAPEVPSNVIQELDTIIVVVNEDSRAIHKVTRQG